MEVVVNSEEKIRLDKFLANSSDYTRSKVEKLLADGLVLVNGKVEKPSYKVSLGDKITFPEEVKTPNFVEAEEMHLDIVYEDADIIVVNKPSGMVVHPGAGNLSHTLANGLAYHTGNLSHKESDRPGIVHRIDKDTSGLLLVAKNEKVHAILAESFKNKTIKRVYIALLKGVFLSNSATIDAPIGRDKKDRKKMCVTKDNSKSAITHLKVLRRFEKFTLVELKLETGRTHQIRVHMKYIGYPVYNDPVYTSDKVSEFGQFLHAKSLEFNHPITGEHMYFECPLPKEFQDFINNLE